MSINFRCFIFFNFWSSKSWFRIRIRIHLKHWIRIHISTTLIQTKKRDACWFWTAVLTCSRTKPGSKRAKIAQKIENSYWIHLLKCWIISFEGWKVFSYSLDILYGGLGISKLQFLVKKSKEKISAVFFSSIFGHQNPGSISGSRFNKCWIRIHRYRISTN